MKVLKEKEIVYVSFCFCFCWRVGVLTVIKYVLPPAETFCGCEKGVGLSNG